MSQNPILFGFQDDSSMWIIIGVVLVLLFFVVAIVVIGLVIFFVMRKRKKAQAAAASPDLQIASELPAGEPVAGYYDEAAAAIPEAAVAVDAQPPVFEPSAPLEEIRADVVEAPPAAPLSDSPAMDFDPSRTVAITRENTVTISYGYIKFVSGVLAGEQFIVEPEGTYIGRESSLAQIVVSDPRISKRHLWIGVKDGRVKIVDQDSRNGTFVNDPKSERITEAVLNSGDTVILGESDVARFEYQT